MAGRLRAKWVDNDGQLQFYDLLTGNTVFVIDAEDAFTKNIGSLSPSTSTITLGTPSGDTQLATVQLKDALGNNIAVVSHVRVYMATDAAGKTPSSAGAGTSVTVGGGGATLKVNTAKLDLDLIVDTTGSFTLSFNNTGGGGTYTDKVCVAMPDGKILVSAALAVPNS